MGKKQVKFFEHVVKVLNTVQAREYRISYCIHHPVRYWDRFGFIVINIIFFIKEFINMIYTFVKQEKKRRSMHLSGPVYLLV